MVRIPPCPSGWITCLAMKFKAIVGALAGLIVVVFSGGVAAAQTVEEVRERDQLIAEQESLLNTYRCLFGVDTSAVSGGCAGRKVKQGPVLPGDFEGTPTADDISVRDQLIVNQESLLNIYRCQFEVDTQLVPDGCADQLGSDSRPPRTNPVAYTAVSAGFHHSCGLRADKSIVCWGRNQWGQAVAPDGKFTVLSAGYDDTCAIRVDETIVCWGEDTAGISNAPRGRFTDVSTSSWHSCGISTDQAAVCWHNNPWGQSDSPEGKFVAIVAGTEHSCGIRVDQTIACWGKNDMGQSDPPAGMFIDVTAGSSYTCGLKADQSIICWGSHSWGQLAAPAGKFVSLSAGESHACGVRTDQTISCWGDSFDDGDVPAGKYTSVSSGVAHSCGVKVDQTVVCWGDNRFNDYGQSDVPGP